MKARIAMCMYGQPRTWKYCSDWILHAFPHSKVFDGAFSKPIRNTAFDFNWEVSDKIEIECDYFLDIKRQNFFNNSIEGGVDFVSDEEVDAMIKKFLPKKHVVTNIEEDEKFKMGGYWHFARMFSSICRTMNLKKMHELETGAQYDLVVFHRYDSFLGPDPHKYLFEVFGNGIRPLMVYTSGGHTGRRYTERWQPGVDDMILMGDDLSMDLLSSWFERIFNHSPNKCDINKFFGPNIAIEKAIQDCGILKFPMNHVSVALARKEADLTRGIFESFEYHQEFWLHNHKAVVSK